MKKIRIDHALDHIMQYAPDFMWYHGLYENYFSLKEYSYRIERTDVSKGFAIAYYILNAHLDLTGEVVEFELPTQWPKYDFTIRRSSNGLYVLYVSQNPDPEHYPTSFQLIERLAPEWSFLRIRYPELDDNLEISFKELQALTADRFRVQYLYEVLLPVLYEAKAKAAVVYDQNYKSWDFYLKSTNWSYDKFLETLTEKEKGKTRPENIRFLTRG